METPFELQVITEIRDAFDKAQKDGGASVSKSLVKKWMASQSINVKGAIYYYVADGRYSKVIEPMMTFEDYFNFIVPYLLDCIKLDVDGEWVHNQYIAGHELVGWITDFWEKDVHKKRLKEFKKTLALNFKEGDKGIKVAIVNGVLEHLFENSGIRKFFSDWREDPELKQAYEDAMLWNTKPGIKPI